MTKSQNDPYTVMINAIRIRIENAGKFPEFSQAAGTEYFVGGYRAACFDILEELSVIRSRDVEPDA